MDSFFLIVFTSPVADGYESLHFFPSHSNLSCLLVSFLSIRKILWLLPRTPQLLPIEPPWDINPLIYSSSPL